MGYVDQQMAGQRILIATLCLVMGACSATPAPTPAPSTSSLVPTSSAAASQPASPDASAPETPIPTESVSIPDLTFSCGHFTFGSNVLTAPERQDQDAPTPAAAAVREEIANAGPESGFPTRGWRLIGADATHQEFLAIGVNGNLVNIVVVDANGTWTLDERGDCYGAVVLANGTVTASWAWGSPGQPGPTTQTFDALVTERSCASGKSADGRIVGPIVVTTAELVLVIFGTHHLPGSQDCQGNPSSRVQVDLGASLGARQLVDGGHLPFGDPTKQ